MKMDYERIRDFIISYSQDDVGVLGEIYTEAVADGVPIIRRETRDFLKTILIMNRPKEILEVGTAVAYSTLVMADTLKRIYKTSDKTLDKTSDITSDITLDKTSGGLSDDIFHIDTCESDPERIKVASHNIERYGEKRITIYPGDAAETLKNIDGKKYDFIFIDAAKAQYDIYLEEAIRLSHTGTVILSDNILADGEILESHFLVEKRDRTIHDRMRAFLYKIKNDDRLETAILSVADGVAVSVVL